MKDFDVRRRERERQDRSFQVGGETFVYRAGVAPEAFASWEQSMAFGEGMPRLEMLEMMDATVVELLEPGQEEAWRRVRDPNGPHPLNLEDLRDVIEWLIAEQTGRPTEQPSGSSSQPDGNGTTSTAVSASQVERASTLAG